MKIHSMVLEFLHAYTQLGRAMLTGVPHKCEHA
jgi:hypothetical protein